MKKQISFSWPAKLTSFEKDEANENFSRGKLKVFYQGETEDHRFFSEEFSEKLIESLPYSPIVSHYDEEKEDFVGHATEQNIYGIVDPCTKPTFSTDEDGITWCICDTVYYTERPDKVGKIAKLIEGHSQSLELDPRTVEYVINYDEKKHFKNIEFTAGRFVGISVLGEEQKPAFTGSAFFEYDEEFESKMKLLKEYCENSKTNNLAGGEKMHFEEFIKYSWGELSRKVADKVAAEYSKDAFMYLIDSYSDNAIFQAYYYATGDCKTLRIYYSMDEDANITLGNVEEVHITYESVEKPAVENNPVNATTTCEADSVQNNVDTEQASNSEATQMENNSESEPKPENAECGDEDKKKGNCEDNADDEGEKDKEDENKDEEKDKKEDDFVNNESPTPTSENENQPNEQVATQVQNVNVENTTPESSFEKASVVNNEQTTNQENSSNDGSATSTSTFSESERAELEALKRDKKINLINSYKDNLTDEEVADFMAKVDNFDEKDLEIELLKTYKKNTEAGSVIRPAFTYNIISENSGSEDPLDSFVKRYSRRK